MNTSIRYLRAGWARLWLLRLCRARLAVGHADDEAEASIRQQLERLHVRRCADGRDALRAKLAELLARRERHPADRRRMTAHPLFADLARVFMLDGDALQVLALVCELHTGGELGAAARADKRYPSTRWGVLNLLGDALGLPATRLRRCLRPRGPLLASGLLALYHGDHGHAVECIEPGDGLLPLVVDDASDASRYLERLFESAGPGKLSLADYPHLADEVACLRDYLAAAVRDRSGASALLYGPPGTGKSELARALADALGLKLYLVKSADEYGEPIESRQRLQAYEAAQRALANNPHALLMFDEIEDVFRHSKPSTTAVDYKSWINRELETARVPCLWVSNRTDCMDESQLRRFDIALEVPKPPRWMRRALLDRQLQRWSVPPAVLEEIVANEAFAPAHYARATRVLERLDVRDSETASRVLRRSLDEVLSLLGRPPLGRTRRAPAFDLALLRIDQPIEPIVELLARRPSARLCLYGPPGTGKSALAEHLAERLGLPLLKRRASDLLSRWVGETEARIAAMFREAEREQAVLCLDEADSFLRDRTDMQHGWEITQVNELLTRLEDFEGIFVASTNLMESLDRAALRRFDFKLRFEWLDPMQRRELFDRYARQFELSADLEAQELARRLDRLDCLTPGDFAAQHRRLEAMPGCAQGTLLQWLQAEQDLKPGMRPTRMGFTA